MRRMVGWNVKRRLLVCLISTVCFITIGLHSLTSISWTRTLLLENGHAALSHRIERDVAPRQNNARQLASYDSIGNSAEGGIGDKVQEPAAGKSSEGNATKRTTPKSPPAAPAKPEATKRRRMEAKIEVEAEDEETFTDCRGNGTLDMTGYPFIDARTIYCGEAPKSGKNTKSDDVIRAPGAISRTLLETMMLGKGKTMREGGHIQEIYIIGDTVMKLLDISMTSESSLVKAKQFSTVGLGKRRYKSGRELRLKDGTAHTVGALYFFPPSLSDYSFLMKFLRTLYRTCASDGQGASRYAVTVHSASVRGKKVLTPFCVYLGLIGGGIKESYVIGTAECQNVKIPAEIKLCELKDVKL